MKHTYERWILAVDVPADEAAPATATVRRLLKHIWRSWGIRCRGFSEDRRILELTQENKRLREIIAVLTAGGKENEEQHHLAPAAPESHK